MDAEHGGERTRSKSFVILIAIRSVVVYGSVVRKVLELLNAVRRCLEEANRTTSGKSIVAVYRTVEHPWLCQ
mgnify:FL=1